MQCRSSRIEDSLQLPGEVTGPVCNAETGVDVRDNCAEGSLDGILEVRLVIIKFEFLPAIE
jgi:hypothetical protein